MSQQYYLIARAFDGMEKAGIVPGKRYPIEGKFCVESYYAIINERGNLMQVPIDQVGIAGQISAIGKKYYLETVYHVKMGLNVEGFKIYDPLKAFIGNASISKGFLTGGFVNSDSRISEHKSATEILDKYLPGYRRSDKGFKLPESVEWIAKLNESHHNDCMRYEKIIENLMEAFDIKTVEGLKHFAENLKKSANIIDAVRKK